jgi:BirA family biotin operon repressor/biotin-[acetyl-CoA-carboxylase] ligase
VVIEKNAKTKKTLVKQPKPLIYDYHLLSYEELDSTNTEARRLAEGGGAHGAFIWAKRQTQGRGRYAREWVSSEGNLFVSILLAPDEPINIVPQISFLASLAAAESVAPLLPDPHQLRCKWPNDLLLGGKKMGGILLESFETLEADGPKRWVIVGLGLNIDHCPEGIEPPATYLKAAGVEIVSAKIVLSRFIHHFIELYGIWQEKGFAPIRKAWLKQSEGQGREVKVSLPQETIYGVFHSVDMQGNLQIQLADGKKRKLAAGDLYLL